MLPSNLDANGLPPGLPDHVYASWSFALTSLTQSKRWIDADKAYQYCLGYIHALQDSHAMDERLCRFLLTRVHEIWETLPDFIRDDYLI